MIGIRMSEARCRMYWRSAQNSRILFVRDARMARYADWPMSMFMIVVGARKKYKTYTHKNALCYLLKSLIAHWSCL